MPMKNESKEKKKKETRRKAHSPQTSH